MDAVNEAARLAVRLDRMSAGAWVREVDRLARFESVSIDEALTLLSRRFGCEYFERHRQIVWPMLEYMHLRFDPEAWADPIGCQPRRCKRPAA
jgi:hypothetical protein